MYSTVQYMYFNKRKQSAETCDALSFVSPRFQWFVLQLLVRLILIDVVSFQSSELRYTANTQLEHRKSPDSFVADTLISSFSPRPLYRHR